MSDLVTEEPMGDGFSKIHFGASFILVLNKETGFFNPSDMLIKNGKNIKEYLSVENTNSFITDLQKYADKWFDNAQKGKSNPHASDCYYHPTLLLHLAWWINPDAFAAVIFVISELLHENNQSKLFDLLSRGPKPTWSNIEPGPHCPDPYTISFSNSTTFSVDKRGWLKSKESSLFIFRKAGSTLKTCPFTEFLRSRNLFNAEYHHPLLLLQRAAISAVQRDDFAECVHAIFCCDDKGLNPLFHKACRQLQPWTPGNWPSTSIQQTNTGTDNRIMTYEELTGTGNRMMTYEELSQEVADLKSLLAEKDAKLKELSQD